MDSKLKIWLLAFRPKTLWAAVAPVIIGTAMAYSDNLMHLLSAFAALLGALLIQIGTNLSNDYYDFIKGVDTEARKGPIRATQAGLISKKAMKAAFIAAFVLVIPVGLYLIWRGGIPILIIGIISIISGILYTAGPFALGYKGLADIFVLIFFGPVAVGGTYWVQTHTINILVIISGFAPGLISAAILTVNNLRDIETDKIAGKKTLAVRFGAGFAKLEYLISLLLAAIIPIILYSLTGRHIFSITSALVLIFAIPSIKKVYKNNSSVELNQTLAATGKLLLIYSLLFSTGWII